MVIAYLIGPFPKLSESFVLREVRELVRRGEDVVVWSMQPPDPDEPPVPEAEPVLHAVRRVPSGPLGTGSLLAAVVVALARRPRRALAAYAWALRWALLERDWRPLGAVPFAAYIGLRLPGDTHVHSHFANAPTTVAQLAARIAGATSSFTGHARDLFTVTPPRQLRDKVHRSAFTVVVAEAAAERVRALAAPADRDKIVVVRNGLEQRPEPLARRPRPGLVASVGRLVEKKGFDTLVEACARLRAQGRDIRCEIAGEGPERDRLLALAGELSLNGALTLRGAADRAAVEDLLARAEAFALPARVDVDGDSDMSPLVILEAMQAGVPVISTSVGGIAEMVCDERSGLLTPPDDAVALADAIARVLDDDGLARRLVAGGHDVVRASDVRRSVDDLVERFRAAREAAARGA